MEICVGGRGRDGERTRSVGRRGRGRTEIYLRGRGRDGESTHGVAGRGRGHRHPGDPSNSFNCQSFPGQQMGYPPVSGQDWSLNQVAAPNQGHSSKYRRLISGHDSRLRQGPSLNEGQFAEPRSFNQGSILYLEPRSLVSRHDHGLRQVPFSSQGKFAEPTIPPSPSVGLVGSASESSGGSCSEGGWKTTFASSGSRNSGSVSGLSENESCKWVDVIEIPDDDETDEEANLVMWAEHDNVLMDNHVNRGDDEIKKRIKVEDIIGNLCITNEKMGSLVGQLGDDEIKGNLCITKEKMESLVAQLVEAVAAINVGGSKDPHTA